MFQNVPGYELDTALSVDRKADPLFMDLLMELQAMETRIKCLRCSVNEEGVKADQLISAKI